ncbi:PRMT5 arginine-N-methyltransferase-domain-containing protein [Phlyctochytrium arcticum]|nr:PRMT5 arginine-N-methyltransferase-domain-containing protein [Phlyctochytrium arcticum]
MDSTEETLLPVGLQFVEVSDVDTLGAVANECGYSFGVLDLLLSERGQSLLAADRKDREAFSPDDLRVTDVSWSQFIVGGISHYDALDAPEEDTRQAAEALVKRQVQWASHLGLNAVMYKFPATENCLNFARVLNHMLGMSAYTQTWVQIPLDSKKPSTWNDWNVLRTICNHNTKLGAAVELGAELPEDTILEQWQSEPIKAVVIPTSVFVPNGKGFPVLPKRHQNFLRSLMEAKVQYIIRAASETESLHPQGGFAAYHQYINHLFRTKPELDVVDKFATGYHDYLQLPLQPLMDNLESGTYEVFEKDPIKYAEYERATFHALKDRVPDDSDIVSVVMVVGAGRGPLVQRALQAAENAKRKVKVYAVEKNPNAIVTLQSRKESEWGDRVEVVHTDMRHWNAPVQADIMISELLGSFGDNELSPECLDGAQKFLKPDGISIPSEYTAFISPLSSTKLYNEVLALGDEKSSSETPYIVKFRAVHELAEPQAVWKFEHPNRKLDMQNGSPDFNQHNNRYAKQRFSITKDALMHGIAGYFEAVLYKDVMISIHPKTHSPGMFSWFPIFFPMKTPTFLSAGSSVDIHFWRCCDSRKVWYEWMVTPVLHTEVEGKKKETLLLGGASTLHNDGGRSYWIGL